MDLDSYIIWKKERNKNRQLSKPTIFQKISDKFHNTIDGYKIVYNLTDEEYSKFLDLYRDWHIWLDGVGDPMDLPETWKIFEETAAENKPKLDAYVDKLHVKYGTNSKEYGIYKKRIVERH
jgi:hypothetical protein